MGIQDRDYWRERYNHMHASQPHATHWREDELRGASSTHPTDFAPERVLKITTLVIACLIAAACAMQFLMERRQALEQERLQQQAQIQAQEKALQQARTRQSLEAARQADANRRAQSRRITEEQQHAARALAVRIQAHKQAAWEKFYQPAPQCLLDATVECGNAFIRARQKFEQQHQPPTH